MFTRNVLDVVSSIPWGHVMSYSDVATLAGNPRGARQVSRILHSMSRKYGLPWHRVISAQGKISLPPGRGYERQKAMLESEGIYMSSTGKIVLEDGADNRP